MEINDSYQQDLASIRSALSMVTLRQSMNQDAVTVDKLLEGMEENSKAVESSLQEHLGNNVDLYT